MDKLASMQTFVTVVERGSFSAAAGALQISKAMASKHVSNLENLLGVRLLHRNTRRVCLTDAGSVYWPRCKAIFSAIEDAESAVGRHSAEPCGTLRVVAPTSFGTFHLTPAIADFKASCPKVFVQLTLKDRVIDLIEEGVDVAVNVGTLPESNLIARRLTQARLVVCATPEYLQRYGTPCSPEELGEHNCLRYTQSRPRDEWTFNNGSGEYTLRVAGDFEASASDAVRMAILGGRGLAQLTTYVVGSDLKAGNLTAILAEFEPAPLPIHVLFPDRRHLASAVRSFVDFLYLRFQPTPYWEEF